MSLVLEGDVTNGCACVGNWEVVEVAATPSHTWPIDLVEATGRGRQATEAQA